MQLLIKNVQSWTIFKNHFETIGICSDTYITTKMFLETVLDVEFQDGLANEKALFYSDTGHSFDSVMLYGHEFSLTIFEVLVFR